MWNFKGTLWNSTQNILPTHWKTWFLYNIEILRALRFKSSYAFLKRPPGGCHNMKMTSYQYWDCHYYNGNPYTCKGVLIYFYIYISPWVIVCMHIFRWECPTWQGDYNADNFRIPHLHGAGSLSLIYLMTILFMITVDNTRISFQYVMILEIDMKILQIAWKSNHILKSFKVPQWCMIIYWINTHWNRCGWHQCIY